MRGEGMNAFPLNDHHLNLRIFKLFLKSMFVINRPQELEYVPWKNTPKGRRKWRGAPLGLATEAIQAVNIHVDSHCI
jgi:hypothetical protein